MNELRELRILVDCAIGDAALRQLHPSGCGCAVCVRRGDWRARRDHIATAGSRTADPFFVRRVEPVEPLIGPLRPGVQRRPLAIGERLPTTTRTGLRQLRDQLWTTPGVFLPGATERQARRWAMRQARSLGGRVTKVEQHRGGRPHFHIEFPPGAPVPVPRSGHIFYGNPPAGNFFEFDEL
jgi:hypothetical protein